MASNKKSSFPPIIVFNLSAATCACLLLLAGAATAQDIVTDTIRVTNTLEDSERRPILGSDIFGDVVVFGRVTATAGRGPVDIYYQRFVDTGVFGPEVAVTDPLDTTRDHIFNDISGDLIVFETLDFNFGPIPLVEIEVYSIAAGTTDTFLTTGELLGDQRVAIHASLLTWSELHPFDSTSSRVLFQDVGQIAPRTVLAGDIGISAREPQIGGTLVVWQEEDPTEGAASFDVYAYDLRTGLVIPIDTSATDQRDAETSGSWVVYTDTSVDPADPTSVTVVARAFNVDTAERIEIAQLNLPGDATTGGRFTASVFGNFVAYQQVVAGNFDLFLYDLTTGQRHPLATGPANQWFHNIFENHVTYVQDGFGASGAKLEVFIATFDIPPALNIPLADLGIVPDGSFSGATDINDLGQVVGTSDNIAGHFRAVLLSESAAPQDLGSLGGVQSFANAINDHGEVVGFSDTAGGETHAFLWNADNGMLDLGTLPGESSSFANDINDFSQVVGSSGTAFLWDGGLMIDLGTLGGTINSAAHGINNRGQVVGISNTAAGEFHAFALTPEDTDLDGVPDLWNRDVDVNGSNDLMVDLGTIDLPGSQAVDINDQGQAVGWNVDVATGELNAFLWTMADGMTDLGNLGGVNPNARAINDFGQIVGVADITAGTAAFVILAPDGDMVRIANTTSATDINNRGQIVGRMETGGETHAYIAQVAVPSNTAPGVLMDVLLDDGGPESSEVIVTFDEVFVAGDTTITFLDGSVVPPDDFQHGMPPLVFDLATTADFAPGSATICVAYDETAFGDETALALLHSSDGGITYDDVTTSLDTDNDRICGAVSSFSIVGVFENLDTDGDGVPDNLDACPDEDATGFDVDNDGCIDSLAGLMDLVTTLVEEGVISEEMQNSLLSKITNAEKSFDKDKVCTAVNQLGALKNQVDAQRGEKISDEAADMVTAYADSLIAYLESQLAAGDTC